MRKMLPLEKDEYPEVDRKLNSIRDSLHELVIRFAHSYPASNRAVRLSKKALATIDTLSGELDNQRRRDHPEEVPLIR